MVVCACVCVYTLKWRYQDFMDFAEKFALVGPVPYQIFSHCAMPHHTWYISR